MKDSKWLSDLSSRLSLERHEQLRKFSFPHFLNKLNRAGKLFAGSNPEMIPKV